MYCKHCGKVIADDSRFCPYCGGSQIIDRYTQKIVYEQKRVKEGNCKENESSISLFISKYKLWIVLYAIWVIINIIFLLLGEEKVYEKTVRDTSSYSLIGNTFKAKEVFFPFTSSDFQTSYMFNVKYYDWTEFFVYCLLIPLIIYILSLLWKSMPREKLSTYFKDIFDVKRDNYDALLTPPVHNMNIYPESSKTPTQNYRAKRIHENAKNDTKDKSLNILFSIIKWVGIIIICLFVFLLSLMYLNNFFLGWILSISCGLFSAYLVKKYKTSGAKGTGTHAP
jgi:hypothetical protein